MDEQQKKQMTLHIAPDKRTGVYANMASITLAKNEVILDFAMIMPGTKDPEAELVQRVILSPDVAQNFLSAFQNATLDFKKRTDKEQTNEN